MWKQSALKIRGGLNIAAKSSLTLDHESTLSASGAQTIRSEIGLKLRHSISVAVTEHITPPKMFFFQ